MKKIKNKMLARKFCSCIKAVRNTVKVRGKRKPSATDKESAAIGICVRSVLNKRGKTLKKFQCAKPMSLVTQRIKL